jgi:hypothetical protein
MALMFLTEKRDKSVKGRMVYNGKPTREWLSQEDAASVGRMNYRCAERRHQGRIVGRQKMSKEKICGGSL